MSDVGKSKAQAAADFIMKRVPGCKVTPYQGMVQDKDEEFYKQFKLIISGLDNIEARRWLNSLIVGLVEYDDEEEMIPSSIIPLIDGGTEGLRGQGRLILPKITACFECTLDSFPPQQAFPMCTIAETPRLPEHCIAYVYSEYHLLSVLSSTSFANLLLFPLQFWSGSGASPDASWTRTAPRTCNGYLSGTLTSLCFEVVTN